jgi:hypothetical protein
MATEVMHRSGRALECPQCSASETAWASQEMRKRVGWFAHPTSPFEVVTCTCGRSFTMLDAASHAHSFTRWAALSTHVEFGAVTMRPGEAVNIELTAPFDVVGPTNITLNMHEPGFMLTAARPLAETQLTIMTSMAPGETLPPTAGTVVWAIHGIRDANSHPTWWLQLYAAMENAAKWNWKPALIDYASAFETYVETFLSRTLTQRYGQPMADYLLKEKKWIDDRVKGVMELATNHRLSERSNHAIYSAWDNDVRIPRNKLAHGDAVPITGTEVEKAHQAVIKAIQWIETLAPSPPP